jgi:tRNA A-37 threonylcarbamoyl transferase component Bud32
VSSGETNGKGQDETGRLLAGRYRVVAQLGRGGMGVVWRAVDEVLGREVAVKELRTYTDADGPELADLRLRMQREARAAARVRHPGVVAVHDVAEVDGRPLIVMELVDGPSLDAVLRERGPLDPREVAGIGARVMDALAAAHEAGVLHRDVKPGNILLDRSGRVLLTDFGIATMDDPGDGAATQLTRTGHLVGSLDYMAPERAQGADPGPASDVWALGATLYAAVEGASPFRRTSTFSTLTAIVGEPLPAAHRAGALGPVLERLLDKRAEARPGAEEARELLQAVADAAETDSAAADGVRTDSATTTLRAAAPAGQAEPEPEPETPLLPPGFRMAGPAGAGAGSAQPQPTAPPEPAAATGFDTPGQAVPGAQGFGAPAAHSGTPGQTGLPVQGFGPPLSPEQPPTGLISDSDPPRRKGRALLVAAAVTVVLAMAGTAVALLNNTGSAEADTRPPASGTSATASTSARPDADRSSSPEPKDKGAKKTPGAKKTSGGNDGSGPSSSASATSTANSAGGGTSGGGSGGSSGDDGSGGTGDGGTGGGGASSTPAPTPACTAIGGGKYNCTVWKTATSYTASGAEAGVLHAGTNYFFCQSNLGRRETSGEWTNVWWAKTDDDSGNTGVWVSDVYVRGGSNDEPVPGLPVC